MTYFPIPRDDNGHPLTNHGTEFVTYRWASIPFSGSGLYSGSGLSGNQIFLPMDIKTYTLHIESGTTLATVSGTASGSVTAYRTNSGYDLPECRVAVAASGFLMDLRAPASGTTINVSLFGWR